MTALALLAIAALSRTDTCGLKEVQADDLRDCTSLVLDNDRLSPDEVQILVDAMSSLDGLQIIKLRSNGLTEAQGDSIMAAFAQHGHGLTSFIFRDNPLGEHGLASLSTAVSEHRLYGLDLRGVSLGDSGAEGLASSLLRTRSLAELDIENCQIGARGMSAIARALQAPHSALEILRISFNPMGDEGALAIASAITSMDRNRVFKQLVVRDDSIGPSGKEALRKAAKSGSVEIYDSRRERRRKSWRDEL